MASPTSKLVSRLQDTASQIIARYKDRLAEINQMVEQALTTNTAAQSTQIEAITRAVTASANGVVSTAKGRLASKYPPPEQLETITTHISFMQKGSRPFYMKFLPDTGANITALDITHAKGIILEETTVTLKVANGTYLKTLGTAEANFTMNGISAPELIYIVE